MEAEPTPRVAAPRGRPRVLPITAGTLAEMAQKGISAAEVCVRLKVTAKQLVSWCYRNNTTYPGLPKGTKSVAVLQSQVDAAIPGRVGGVFLPIKVVGQRIIVGRGWPEGDISDVEAWCVLEVMRGRPAVAGFSVELPRK